MATKSTARRATKVDPAIVSAVAKEVTPKLVRALQSAVSLTAYEAVEHALAKREQAQCEQAPIVGEATRCPPGGVDYMASWGEPKASTFATAPSLPELIAAIDRVEYQLDRISNAEIGLHLFAERLTGRGVAPANSVPSLTGGPVPHQAGTLPRLHDLGDRVARVAEQLAAVLDHLDKAA